jgi:hypothetical protein
MKLTKRIKALIERYRLHKNIDHYVNQSKQNWLLNNKDHWHTSYHDYFLRGMKDCKKGGLIRNLTASYFKQVRVSYPHKPDQDWKANKKIYEDYFKMEGHITEENLQKRLESNEPIYVTTFTNVRPYKGTAFAQYGAEYSGMEHIKNTTSILNLTSDKWQLMRMRYATPEEIKNYKNLQAQIDILTEEREAKQNEAWEIQKTINALYDKM